MIRPKATEKAPREVPAAVKEVVDTRDRLIDRWSGHYLGAGRNLHHRQLRSQGPRHTPGNLVSLSGSGTTGTHGHVHANPALAVQYGFIVPSWVEDPSWVPIRLAGRYGKRDWHLLRDDGLTVPLAPGDVVRIMRDLGVWGQTDNWL